MCSVQKEEIRRVQRLERPGMASCKGLIGVSLTLSLNFDIVFRKRLKRLERQISGSVHMGERYYNGGVLPHE